MRLQSIMLPADDLTYRNTGADSRELFYRCCGGEVESCNEGLLLSENCLISFNTCFGAFFSEKWLRYTNLSTLWTGVELKGRASLSVMRMYKDSDGNISEEQCVGLTVDHEGEYKHIKMELSEIKPDSMYYLCIHAESGVCVADAYFGCDNEDDADRVKIGIGICTYKREQAVENNLAVIDRGIFKNKNTALAESFCVYISDNGRTLEAERLQSERVHIVPNRNSGGTGGFTRCMLEIMDNEPSCTHVLLMDDDILLPTHALELTHSFLSLLKPEHKDISVGGALWQSDHMWRQYEAGAAWDGCSITAFGKDVDLRSSEGLFENSLRCEMMDYNGWWYTCIPVFCIKEVGLPLPLFLHRDDIEYGMRLNGRFVIPDGVGVWHETFERKMSGASEYYDLRNMLIINSIHRPKFSKNDYIAFIRKWYLRNLFSHRYKYIEMNLAGVRDALRGVDWLKSVDPEQLNARVRTMDNCLDDADRLAEEVGITDFYDRYGRQMAERFDMTTEDSHSRLSAVKRSFYSALTVLGFGGLLFPPCKKAMLAVHPTPIWRFFASDVILHADAFGKGFIAKRSGEQIRRSRSMYRETVRLVREHYDEVCAEYRKRKGELISEEFWRKLLCMNEK